MKFLFKSQGANAPCDFFVGACAARRTMYSHPPRRALRDTPPAHRTTHANYVCAGPGGGDGHSCVVPFGNIVFYYCDHPGTTTHENCIFAGPGIVPPLRRGELYSATVCSQFSSIGGVGAGMTRECGRMPADILHWIATVARQRFQR